MNFLNTLYEFLFVLKYNILNFVYFKFQALSILRLQNFFELQIKKKV